MTNSNTVEVGVNFDNQGNISQINYNPEGSQKVIEITKGQLQRVMDQSINYKTVLEEISNNK